MQRASQTISNEDRAAVAAAVAKAESRTAAEIVPVVATASGRYDRAEDIAGLWLGVLAMLTVWALWPWNEPIGSWGGAPAWSEASALASAVVIGFVVGALVCSRSARLTRLFTPRVQLRQEVLAGARHAFFDNRVHHAPSRSGLMIYVSLLEHEAVVLADKEILARLGQEKLNDLCAQLKAGLTAGGVADALCRAIQAAGEMLVKVLPAAEGNPDELPNSLVILDRPL
jgi:putative membrane protein